MSSGSSRRPGVRRALTCVGVVLTASVVAAVDSAGPIAAHVEPDPGAAESVVTISAFDREDDSSVTPFRYVINEDTAHQPGDGTAPWATNPHSYSPVAATGDDTSASISLPPGKYLVSLIGGEIPPISGEDDGSSYKSSGAHFTVDGSGDPVAVEVGLVHGPLPTASVVVEVFHDNNSVNGARDIPVEEGLEGFAVLLEDGTGEVSVDIYGNPICTQYDGDTENGEFPAGNIVGGTGGQCLTDADGVVTIPNLGPLKYGVFVNPPNGSGWIQTSTIEGTHIIDTWVQEGNNGYLAEQGNLTAQALFGFVQECEFGLCPSLTGQGDPVPPPSPTPPQGSATITGTIREITEGVPGELGPVVPKPLIALNNLSGNDEQVYTGRGAVDGTFSIPNVPPGTYQVVIWDEPLDEIIQFRTVIVAPEDTVVDVGEYGVPRWFGVIEGYVYWDTGKDASGNVITGIPESAVGPDGAVPGAENGFRDCQPDATGPHDIAKCEDGIANQDLDIRFKDGSIKYATFSDSNGYYEFPEVFPFPSFMVWEVGFGRFKQVGTMAYFTEPDADGGANTPIGYPYDPENMPGCPRDIDGNRDPACDPADAFGPASLLQGALTFAGSYHWIDTGKVPYPTGENGGISGIVHYAVTRNEYAPFNAAAEDYEPGVPNVPVNLYEAALDASQQPIACDAVGDGCPFGDDELQRVATRGGTVTPDGITLVDVETDFLAVGVTVGTTVHNLTDGSSGVGADVAAHEITLDPPLSGGTDNVWETGDTYEIDAGIGGAVTPDGITLTDVGADFATDGVQMGMVAHNLTDGSSGVVSDVAPTRVGLAPPLSGGTDDVWETGDAYAFSWNGSATATTDGTTLEDENATFATNGVTAGMTVTNLTDGASGEIASVSETQLTLVAPLTDGATWDVGDAYEIDSGIAGTTTTDGVTLVDPDADFVADGVTTGMLVHNLTDGSSGVVDVVTTTELTLDPALAGGADNTWASGDEYAFGSTGSVTPDGVTLIDTDADFVALGVLEDMEVRNLTDGSSGVVAEVTQTRLTLEGDGLAGGGDDVWATGDAYEISAGPNGWLLDAVETDAWDANVPTDCRYDDFLGGQVLDPLCKEVQQNLNQLKDGVFDGGYAFEGVIAGAYIVEMEAPAGYRHIKEEDQNTDQGDDFVPAVPPPPCSGPLHEVNDGRNPDDGKMTPSCESKFVRVVNGTNPPAEFYVMTEFDDSVDGAGDPVADFTGTTAVPPPGFIRGFMSDDLNVDFDPDSPNYRGKRGVPNTAIGILDFDDNEIAVVNTDKYGYFEVLLPSGNTISCPTPGGICPSMYKVVGNYPGQDPLHPVETYNPNYSTLTLPTDVWTGKTTFSDVAIIPITASPVFAQQPECAASGPVVDSVSAVTGQRGSGFVINGSGFGTGGSVTLAGSPLTVNSRSDTAIDVTIPAGNSVPTGPGQLVVTDTSGRASQTGITFHVIKTTNPQRYDPPTLHVGADQTYSSIQAAIDAAAAGSLIIVHPGTYYELPIVYKNVKIQGFGPGATSIDGRFFGFGGGEAHDPAEWIAKVDGLRNGQGPLGPTEVPIGQVVTVVATANNTHNNNSFPTQIDGFTIVGGDTLKVENAAPRLTQGGGVYAHFRANRLQVSNNVIQSNSGSAGGGVVLGQAYVGNNNNGNVRIHHNRILNNGGFILAGGIGVFAGANDYEIDHNQLCGNYSAEYGGGISHFGFSPGGQIHDNTVEFNSSFDEGGGIIVASELSLDPAVVPTGSGEVTIERNLIRFNVSNDDGGGIRLLSPIAGPVHIVNNMVVDNLATDIGGGIALDDALDVEIIHNTVAHNVSTATAEDADRSPECAPDGGLETCEHAAGISSTGFSAALLATGPPTDFSDPRMFGNVIWQNNAFHLDAAGNVAGGTTIDLEVLGTASPETMTPNHAVLTALYGSGTGNTTGDPLFADGSVFVEYQVLPFVADPAFVAVQVLTTPGDPLGDYHLQAGSSAIDHGVTAFDGVLAPPIDIDGETRIAPPDSGADERVGGQ